MNQPIQITLWLGKINLKLVTSLGKKILNTSLENYAIQGRLLHIRKYNFCLLSDIIPKQLMYLSPSQPLRLNSRNASHPHDNIM